MDIQVSISFEAERALSEQDLGAISSELSKVQDGSLRIQSEKAMGGIEICMYLIWIVTPFLGKVAGKISDKLADKVADKIVDLTMRAIGSLRASGVQEIPKTVTLNAAWDGGEVKIILPSGQEAEKTLKSRLTALSNLLSTF